MPARWRLPALLLVVVALMVGTIWLIRAWMPVPEPTADPLAAKIKSMAGWQRSLEYAIAEEEAGRTPPGRAIAPLDQLKRELAEVRVRIAQLRAEASRPDAD